MPSPSFPRGKEEWKREGIGKEGKEEGIGKRRKGRGKRKEKEGKGKEENEEEDGEEKEERVVRGEGQRDGGGIPRRKEEECVVFH